mmetsp:Transcript_25908/g.78470  ORF Transcript_25908/g.78470 Transcript_25908/m.78470 type:complete len:375 (-) Transcript_25908:926-2050(-)
MWKCVRAGVRAQGTFLGAVRTAGPVNLRNTAVAEMRAVARAPAVDQWDAAIVRPTRKADCADAVLRTVNAAFERVGVNVIEVVRRVTASVPAGAVIPAHAVDQVNAAVEGVPSNAPPRPATCGFGDIQTRAVSTARASSHKDISGAAVAVVGAVLCAPAILQRDTSITRSSRKTGAADRSLLAGRLHEAATREPPPLRHVEASAVAVVPARPCRRVLLGDVRIDRLLLEGLEVVVVDRHRRAVSVGVADERLSPVGEDQVRAPGANQPHLETERVLKLDRRWSCSRRPGVVHDRCGHDREVAAYPLARRGRVRHGELLDAPERRNVKRRQRVERHLCQRRAHVQDGAFPVDEHLVIDVCLLGQEYDRGVTEEIA